MLLGAAECATPWTQVRRLTQGPAVPIRRGAPVHPIAPMPSRGRDRCPERSAAQRVAHGLAPETSGGRENRVGWLRLSGFQRFSQVKTM